LLAVGLHPQPASDTYDLLLKGGHVIDPKNGVDEVRDVAIRGGRIAEVAANIGPERGDFGASKPGSFLASAHAASPVLTIVRTERGFDKAGNLHYTNEYADTVSSGGSIISRVPHLSSGGAATPPMIKLSESRWEGSCLWSKLVRRHRVSF